MSLLQDLANAALQGATAPKGAPTQMQGLLNGVLGLLESSGGVQGLAEKFQQSGLEDLISSWIGTGQNKSITADQLAQVLGSDRVQALAQQANIPAEKGAGILSELLPVLIDKLTPDGRMPVQSTGHSSWGRALLGGLEIVAAAASNLGQNEGASVATREDPKATPGA